MVITGPVHTEELVFVRNSNLYSDGEKAQATPHPFTPSSGRRLCIVNMSGQSDSFI